MIYSIEVKKLHSGTANEILKKKGLFEIVLVSVTKSIAQWAIIRTFNRKTTFLKMNKFIDISK